MARVVLVGNLAQLTGGVAEFQLPVTSVKQLFQQLTELHPALGPHLEEGVAVAIDGQIYQDTLLEPIGPDSEVFVLPQIAGGSAVTLPTLLGDYPGTHALRSGALTSPAVRLAFADVKGASAGFKRAVRAMEFDVTELAIVTFLIAKAHGVPLVLLPAVVLGRFQHPYLVYDRSRGTMTPADLGGKRVGIRSYSVTTATWVRGIMADDWGVDLDAITWITFEEPHVAGFRDPPNVRRADAGQDMLAMLLAGDLDAAILGGEPPKDPRVVPLIPDPAGAARTWQAKHDAIQVNHMVTVKASLSREQPHVVGEVYRLLAESKRLAGLPKAGELDTTPFGVDANRRNLDVALDYVFRQRLIPRRYTVDELFDDVTRTLGP
jgi:4,5-dihydroxyphthalate decarboxylase